MPELFGFCSELLTIWLNFCRLPFLIIFTKTLPLDILLNTFKILVIPSLGGNLNMSSKASYYKSYTKIVLRNSLTFIQKNLKVFFKSRDGSEIKLKDIHSRILSIPINVCHIESTSWSA